ncbi:hypothetical protein V6R86_01825 [Sphingomonas kaistensis]|uniref:Uncharacterized protein n=1 Tax=Sphingomonas kaistensis TaxID=298708 RepID=A0ABZ2G0F8_9SPHN
MRLFNSVAELRAQAAKLARETSNALKTAGDTLNGAKSYISTHQPAIATKTQQAILTAARVVESAGERLSASAETARSNHRIAPSANRNGKPGTAHQVESYILDVCTAAATFTQRVGERTIAASPAIGAAAGGAINGAAGALSGAFDAVAISQRHLEELYSRIRTASPAVRREIEGQSALIGKAQRERRKKDLLDLLTAGGVSLSFVAAHPSQTPPYVEEAFRLAYPGLAAAGETFSDAVYRLPPEDLVGLVSGVKGKLFELELLDHLNSGNLPEGLHAELPQSATQPGFDIQIIDESGRTVDVLQAKATESAAYVQDALQRYPGIDVTTTAEVHAQLVAMGVTENITNSGISENALEAAVSAAAGPINHLDAGDLIPSSIGLAVIALSTFMDGSLTVEQRSAEFGDRAAKASVAGTAAAAALAATGAWWIALAAGVGSRSLASLGDNKRQRYEMLKRVALSLEARNAALAVATWEKGAT